MTVSTTTKLDSTAAALRDGAAKLADVLKQHASLKAELETAASDADAAGLADFADVFRDMAAKLGPLSGHDGKASATPGRRRGRPPKPADAEPSAT